MQKLSSLAFKKATHAIEGTHLTIDKYRLLFEPGQVTVLGSYTGMGRTTLMLYLFQALYQNYGKPQLFVCNEMSEELLYRKFVASVSGVALSPFGDVPAAVIEKHEVLSSEVCHFLYYGKCWPEMKTMLSNWAAQNRNGILFIDKLQALYLSGHYTKRNRVLRVILSELKEWAVEYQISVIVSSGIRREKRDLEYRPQIKSLKNSSIIEEVADLILLLYRSAQDGFTEDGDGNNLRNFAELLVAKNIQGPLMTVRLHYDAQVPCFRPFDGLERMAFGNRALDKFAHQFGLESLDEDAPF